MSVEPFVETDAISELDLLTGLGVISSGLGLKSIQPSVKTDVISAEWDLPTGMGVIFARLG